MSSPPTAVAAVRAGAPRVKLEPTDHDTPVALSPAAAAPSPLSGKSGGTASSSPPTTPAVKAVADDDDGVLQIADAEGDEAGVLEASAFVDVDMDLTSAEEAPPHHLPAEYAEALFNTDPRVAFEVLHIGAMRAIEREAGLVDAHTDYHTGYVPPTELVRQSRDGVSPFFTVPLMHPRVRARPLLERCDHDVDELLARPSRTALVSCIGPDIMDRLRLSHATQLAQRRRAAARKATREGGKG